MGKKKDKKAPEKAEKAAETLARQSDRKVPSDVQGSYTGTPLDNGRPVQDADDL